jgi:hypothetical protein
LAAAQVVPEAFLPLGEVEAEVLVACSVEAQVPLEAFLPLVEVSFLEALETREPLVWPVECRVYPAWAEERRHHLRLPQGWFTVAARPNVTQACQRCRR